MKLYAFCNNLSKFHRHRITNISCNFLKVIVFCIFCKLVIHWKCLYECSFSEWDCSILLRMSVPSISYTQTKCSEGRGWLIPFHSCIHTTAITLSRCFLMAIWNKMIMSGFCKCSPVLRDYPNPLFIERTHILSSVVWITRVYFTYSHRG